MTQFTVPLLHLPGKPLLPFELWSARTMALRTSGLGRENVVYLSYTGVVGIIAALLEEGMDHTTKSDPQVQAMCR